jgi:hypothetical protein
LVDVLFPKAARFGVALESRLDREDHHALIKFEAGSLKVSFVVGIVDANKVLDIWRRRMSTGINGISRVDNGDNDRSEANKETIDSLLNPRRVGFGKFLKGGAGMR